MDTLIPKFAAASPAFVSDYNNARVIVDTAAAKAKAKPTPPTT